METVYFKASKHRRIALKFLVFAGSWSSFWSGMDGASIFKQIHELLFALGWSLFLGDPSM